MRDETIFQNGESVSHSVSVIQEFYECKNVLITGVTGFLGKTLAEKLLRSCPGLEKLFILVRDKNGKDANGRCEEIFEDAAFDLLRKHLPTFKSKVVVIRADCAAPGLGLSDQDRQTLIEKTNVIFHSAAKVKFDEHLRLALSTNTRAPLDLLELAKQMRDIKAFIYVSTIYCHPFLERMVEKIYPCHVEYDKLQKTIGSMTNEQVEKLLPSLIGPWPNTYTFCKALAEKELALRAGTVPLCIFRPGVVLSTANEPTKGWIDNMHGPTTMAIASMMGVIRTVRLAEMVSAEIVPADYVANCLLATAANVSKIYEKCKPEEIPIYNYVSSVENRMTWRDFLRQLYTWVEVYPFSNTIWYPTTSYEKSKIIYEICVLFLHILPALLFDGISICVGKKPKLIKTYRKIRGVSYSFEHFTLRDSIFCNRAVRELWARTSDIDKQWYPFSMAEIDWDVYFSEYLLGCRRYLFQDSDDTLPEAKKKLRRLYYIHQIFRASFLLLSAYGVWTILSLLLL